MKGFRLAPRALVVLGCLLGSAHPGAAPHALIAGLSPPASAAAAPARAPVRLGMMTGHLSSTSDCARNWTRSGWDPEILHAVAQRLLGRDRAAGACVQVPVGQAFANGTLTGGLRALADGEVDLYGKGRFPGVVLRAAGAAFLYPHRQENMCVMVPRAGADASAVSLPSFSPSIYLASALCVVAFAGALPLAYGVPPGRALLEVARTAVSGAFDARRHGRLMLWLSLLSFFVVNAFAGCFVGALVAPPRDREADTLRAADAALDALFAPPASADAVARFRRDPDPVLRALAAKTRVFRAAESSRVLRDAAAGRRAGVLTIESGIDVFFRFPEASGADGRPLFHRVRECVLSPSHYAFAARAAWPLRARFDALLQRLVEGGVVALLVRRGVDAIARASGDWEPPPEYLPLAPERLGALFRLWGAGAAAAAAAAAAFLGELLCARMRLRTRLGGRLLWK